MFINTQNMAVQSPEHDDFWDLDDDFRMEILETQDVVDGVFPCLEVTNDVIRMYCGM
jgi:hypothetical protein